MPKIYQSERDFEREKLQQQSHGLSREAQAHDSTSLGMVLVGAALSVANLFRQKASIALTLVSDVLYIGGVIEWYRASKARSKAHDLKLEAERIPHAGNAVILEDAPAAQTHTCHCHAHTKGHAKTPLEHAAHTGSAIEGRS